MATIIYTNTLNNAYHETIRGAMSCLLREYPSAVAVDAGGFPVDAATPDSDYDIRNGRAAMVWANADDAGEPGLGDDGAKCVATIEVEESDDE